MQSLRKTVQVISFLLFPVTFVYITPSLAVMGTVERVVTSALLFWAAFALSSLVLGRSACSWLCPLGGQQECLHMAAQRPLVKVRPLRWVKYLLTIGWVGVVVMLAIKHGGYTRVDPLSHTGLPPEPKVYVSYFVLLSVITAFALVLGRRGFCRYVCLFSGLNIAGSTVGRWLRLPRLRLTHGSGRCTQCGKCEQICPTSLPVGQMVRDGELDHHECIHCGQCAEVCEEGAVKLAFKK